MPDLCIIVGSAGAFDALPRVLGALPGDYPLPVILGLHRAVSDEDQAEIMLARMSSLSVRSVMDKDRLRPGTLFLTPGGYHTLVDDAHLALSLDAPVAYARPSLDLLLASAVDTGARILCAVLSGSGQDGSRGAALVAMAGGSVLVQDPAEAAYGAMPKAALGQVRTAQCLPAAAIGARLAGVDRRESSERTGSG